MADEDPHVDGVPNQNDDITSLKKKKTLIQSAFTRIGNTLSKLLSHHDTPYSVLIKTLDELSAKYQQLEEKCEEISLLVDDDPTLEALLSDKYCLLSDLRIQVTQKEIIPQSTNPSQSQIDATSLSSCSETDSLIKSFQASLTLPKPEFKRFNGDPCCYAEFMSYIDTYVEVNVTDPKQRLTMLINTCDGMARDSIGYLIQSSNSQTAYVRAKQTLKDMFGGKFQISRAVVDDCTNGKPIRGHEVDELKRLIISLKKAEITLTENNCPEDLYSSDKLLKVYRRLPKPLQYRWNDKVMEIQEKGARPSFIDICRLIEVYVKSRDNEYCDYRPGENQQANKQTGQIKSQKNIFSLTGTDCKWKCEFCNNAHYLNQCSEFCKLDLKSKAEFVSKHKLCRNCLHKGHFASNCKRKGLCKKCKAKHNDILHDNSFIPGPAAGPSQAVVQGQAESMPNVYNVNDSSPVMAIANDENIVAGIACVEVLVEGKDALFKCKAIIDNKSSVNLCSERLADRLNKPFSNYCTTFNVATGNSIVQGKRFQDVKIYSNDMQNYVFANELLTVKQIPLSMNSVFTQDDVNCNEHLKGIELPKCTSNDEIDLLIGSGVPKAFHKYDERKGMDGQIYAVKLTLGWDLVGPKSQSKGKYDSSGKNIFFVENSRVDDLSLDKNLGRLFHQDFSDCTLFSSKTGPSVENLHAVKFIESSVCKKDGKFCVGIPWKENPVNLPSNKVCALKRLHSLKRKFINDDQLHKMYSKEMQKFINSGFIELSKNHDTKLCHFIPHHPVWHPRKGSLRIVWDCAVSLNEFIHDGPDLLASLHDVLIRFRRFKFAITSDIRKMYLNVRVPNEDRGALRILWWPDGDYTKDPIEYRAAVHIYGAKSSGFIANYCIQMLAKSAQDHQVSEVLLKDLYVDDQASSVQNEQQAVCLIQGLYDILKYSGFHLTKFVSNSMVICDAIDKLDKDVSLESEEAQSKEEHSILGVKWHVKTDELSFVAPTPDVSKSATCRNLLSIASQIYDPLGVVAPATLPVKVLLQEKSANGWDNTDPDIQRLSDDFNKVLKLIPKLKVPRCYKPSNDEFNNPVHISIHGFSDASNLGYSAVVYLRQQSSDGKIVVSFVIGKSRVAPKFKGKIPAATVPKLELNAAALLVKLVEKVKTCIDMNIQQVFYWCDSQAVISSLYASNKRFPVYWSNRIAIILGLSEVKQWRYVPSKCNSADIGSRGVSSKDFDKSISMWLSGPSFLMLSEEKWPEKTVFKHVDVMLTEVVDQPMPVQIKDDLLTRLINHYSKLPKLLNVVARLLRFMDRVRQSKNCSTSLQSYIHAAEQAVLRVGQSQLDVSCLKRLKPFQDEKGLYRVQSRLSNVEHLLYDEKHPIIIPKHSNLTKIIIFDEHERSAHMGVNHVLSNLRTKYWVIGGKSTIKGYVGSCRKCKEENARPLQQMMCSLPKERCTPSFPFQHVGLDYFGPFICKVRRQRVKRYGCVFVCLSTRAVHIESVSSLETNAFLCAFSRFMSRRGKPAKVYSDNASTFVGAQKELKSLINSVNECMSDYSIKNGFEWHFHPPHGSHHAGHYERMIRTIRKVLRGLTNEQEMCEDVLLTFLCEAEKVLNDRPLGPVSEDPNDFIPLTPNQILLLRGNSCLPTFDSNNLPRQFHKQAQYMADVFWKRWLKEYLPSLQARQKWCNEKRNLKVGDMVFLCDEGHSRGKWPIARVIEVVYDCDSNVRRVIVKDKLGLKERPISKLALLEGID